MTILSIDTSCDETSAAVTDGRKILSNEIYSQILIHKKWGGVVPHLAKRAHEERIGFIVESALKKAGLVFNNVILSKTKDLSRPPCREAGMRENAHSGVILHSVQNDLWKNIDYIAVTQGPGLAPALEVGIRKAKELAKKYHKKIIAVNHMEGHIYSCFAQNSQGNPKADFQFPYLALLVSGGHTMLVLFKDQISYEILGDTVDDAAGEALDKAAKLLGLGYPGGGVIERLAQSGDSNYHRFPRPMTGSSNLNFSFSGLKTSFYYFVRQMPEKERVKHLEDLAASFQEAVFDSLLKKLEMAMKQTGINNIVAAGGVMANQYLRNRIRRLVKKNEGSVLFPPFKTLYGDNAAMIGVAAHFKAEKGIFVKDIEKFERMPRLSLKDQSLAR